MPRDSRFQRFTAPAGENSPEGTPDSEVYARVSTGKVKDADGNNGPDVVRTLDGERTLNAGDVVIEKPDQPGTYDVVSKDGWADLDWSGESSDSGTTARKSTASKSTQSKSKSR